jgi:hypothetical protein
MNTFKPPSRRVRPQLTSRVRDTAPVKEGSFLYNIINPKPTVFFEFKKGPIYKVDRYLKMLKKNNEEMGIPYKEPNLPVAKPYQLPEKSKEPYIEYPDRVHVTLRILKSGIVRVKINTGIAMLHEKYYSRAKFPSIKELIQVYKSHGFSEEFINKIKKSHEKKVEYAKKVGGILEKIFDTKKPKKVKKAEKKKPEPEPELIEEEEIMVADPLHDEDEDEEDIIPDEDGHMDVEPDEEDEEEVADEEEYVLESET